MYTRLQPVLHVADLTAEAAFYDALGFEVKPTERPGFVAVAYGGGPKGVIGVGTAVTTVPAGILFGLEEDAGFSGPSMALTWRIGVESVADTHALCRERQTPVAQEPRQEPWGGWMMALRSPNGYRVVFEGPLYRQDEDEADEVVDGIRYTASLQDIMAADLRPFFVGWAASPDDETRLRILTGSDHVLLAVDEATDRPVGFINALSDGVLSAYIPLLEVLPGYQGRGIGSELVRRMLSRLEGLYGVDLVCDADLRPFYERFDMMAVTGMVRRRQTSQVDNALQ
jgi:GNAT superfamily N-acetyltransferase